MSISFSDGPMIENNIFYTNIIIGDDTAPYINFPNR